MSILSKAAYINKSTATKMTDILDRLGESFIVEEGYLSNLMQHYGGADGEAQNQLYQIACYVLRMPILDNEGYKMQPRWLDRINWGGAREGAGRPPVNFKIPDLDPDVARWFAALDDAAKIKIITEAYNNK